MARTLAPGEVITQQDWTRFQQETGGPMRSVQIRPPTKAEIESGTDYEQHPVYRYYLADGQSYVEMQQTEKGDYQVIDFKPSPELQKQQTAATTQPAKGTHQTLENGELVTREIEPDGSQGRIVNQILAPASATKPESVAASKREEVKPGVFKVMEKTVDKDGNSIENARYEDAQGNTVPMPSAPAAEPKWSPVYKNKEGQWIQSQTDPNGQITGTRPAPEGAIPADKSGKTYSTVKQDENTGQWHGLTAEGWEPLAGGPGLKPEMPKTLVDLPNGRGKGQLVPDPDKPGEWKAVPVSGTEKPPDTAVATPDLASATMGKYTDLLKKQWDEKYVPLITAGTMTKAEALDQFTKVDRALAESKANEEVAQLNAQQNIRSQDVSQRGQTLGEVQNQRSNAQGVFQTAVGHVVAHPEQFGKYSSGIVNQIMDMYGGMNEKFGIPKGVPSEQPYTPQQSQVMGGATGPSPIVFNINTGGAVPQSAPLAGVGAQMGVAGAPGMPGMPETPGALPPPANPEQLLEEMKRNTPDQFWTAAVDRAGQDLQAAREKAVGGVAQGMSFSGGQLRAPGAGPVGAGPVGQVG